MNLSLDQLGRIAPWFRIQCDRAVDVLFRTEECFGEQGPFRVLTLYDALGFAAFLAVTKTIIDIPIDAVILKVDPFSPTFQAVSIILLLLSATAYGVALFVGSRLFRVASDVAMCMKLGYFLWVFVVVGEILLYPLRAGSERGKLIELTSFGVGPDRSMEFLASLSVAFWLFAVASVLVVVWRVLRATRALRGVWTVATWRALPVVLLAEVVTAYLQGAVLNPLSHQASSHFGTAS